jgi:anhydro-N-acetylmuramic acid kinase
LAEQQVEAAAFAWLAKKCVRRETANLPLVTGAKGLRVLGAIYPR